MSNKLRLQDKFYKNDQRSVKYPRGAIYTCHLGENIGHEKSRLEERPCLIISNNRINYNATNVIVIPLTKEIKYKDNSHVELKYEWHYILKKEKKDFTSLMMFHIILITRYVFILLFFRFLSLS